MINFPNIDQFDKQCRLRAALNHEPIKIIPAAITNLQRKKEEM